MHNQEEIEGLIQAMYDAQPKDLARFMSENQAGIKAVLQLLYLAEGPVTAGTIAEEIGVSTARVAVLLKKMENKDLILREADPEDARVTTVRLSDQGLKTVTAMRQELYRQMGILIDRMGMDRMLEFVAISKEIQDVLKPPSLPL